MEYIFGISIEEFCRYLNIITFIIMCISLFITIVINIVSKVAHQKMPIILIVWDVSITLTFVYWCHIISKM